MKRSRRPLPPLLRRAALALAIVGLAGLGLAWEGLSHRHVDEGHGLAHGHFHLGHHSHGPGDHRADQRSGVGDPVSREGGPGGEDRHEAPGEGAGYVATGSGWLAESGEIAPSAALDVPRGIAAVDDQRLAPLVVPLDRAARGPPA